MPDIKFNCMKCGAEIEAEATLAGKIIQCPRCRNAVKAPENLMSPGMILGGYELGMLLGKGGMGEVWLSTQDSMQRKVALKILSPSLSKDQDLIARFNNEMKMVAKLDHPGIVSAYEAGYANGLYFLATSYVDGVTLESILDSGKVFGEREALRIVRAVAEALQYAWDKHRILHRDIKPANIMIEDGGAVKLMDMGISKSLKDNSSITMTGIIVGTPYYMSPEQAKAEKDIDLRADIYSLGATLYHMLTGHLPYNATSAMAILARVISEEAEPVRKINHEVSRKCELLISRMMAKDRSERQDSWQEVIDDIDNVLDENFVVPEAAAGSTDILSMKDRIMKVTAVAIAFCIVVTAMILISYSHKRPVDPDEELLSIVNEDVPEPAGMRESSAVPRHEVKAAVTEHKASVPEKKTDEAARSAMHQASPAINAENRSAVSDNSEKPGRGGRVFGVILSQDLGLNEKEMEKILPIVKEYFKELRQLRENRPSKGYFTLEELKKNVDRITMNARKKAESVLTKEQSAKLMQHLDEERKTAFRNYMSHPPPVSSPNK